MDISKLKIALKYIFGGIGSVVDYLLDLLNTALAKIDPSKKEQIQAVLNLASRVLATLEALKWLCPTKWQTAYELTIKAVSDVVDALKDLQITKEELEKIEADFEAAVKAWKGEDDETCIDCMDCTFCEAA